MLTDFVMTSPSKRNTMFGGVAFVYTIIFSRTRRGGLFGLNVTVTTPLSPGGMGFLFHLGVVQPHVVSINFINRELSLCL